MIEVGYDHIYAIYADECNDMEGEKLMTIVIWCVSCLSGEISERIVGTVKVDDSSSENMLKSVVNVLS